MTRRAALARSAIAFLVSFAAYALLLQSQPWGDGITYLSYLRDGVLGAHHLFYLPPMWSFVRVAEALGIEERTAAFLFSAFCAAGGNAILTWLLSTSKRLAPACTCPLLLVAVLATAPSLVFFGTQIENHAHHYLWICATLLALDRSLVHTRSSKLVAYLSWSLAGFALLAAFSSHSTSVLLWPALALTIWVMSGERMLRAPTVFDVRNAALFFGFALAFKFLQPSIKVWLTGDPNWGKDTTAEFALSLLDVRSLSTWIDYSWSEVLVPAWGLVWAVLVLGVRRIREHKTEALVVSLAFLPYFAFFGSWNVREFGAYYLAVLPVFVVAIGRLIPKLRREEAVVLLVLILGQAVHASYRAKSWASEQTGAAWNWARDASQLATKNGLVLCWQGVHWLHMDYDHPDANIAVVAFHNWTLTLAGPASLDPEFWQKVADGQLQQLIDKAHDAGGRVFVARELIERLQTDASLRDVQPVLRKIEALGFDEVERGVVRGWLIRKP